MTYPLNDETEDEIYLRRYYWAWMCNAIMQSSPHPVVNEAVISNARAFLFDDLLFEMMEKNGF